MNRPVRVGRIAAPLIEPLRGRRPHRPGTGSGAPNPPSPGGVQEQPPPRLLLEARIDQHARPPSKRISSARRRHFDKFDRSTPRCRYLRRLPIDDDPCPLSATSSLRTTSDRMTENPACFGEVAGQGRLSASGQAAQEHQARSAVEALPARPGRTARGRAPWLGAAVFSASGISGLGQLHALDLAPDRRAIRPVERQQRSGPPRRRGAKIRLDKCIGQVAAALERQLHGQEGDVGDRVGVAKPLVELDAVDHDPVVRAGVAPGTSRRDRGEGRRACRGECLAPPGRDECRGDRQGCRSVSASQSLVGRLG